MVEIYSCSDLLDRREEKRFSITLVWGDFTLCPLLPLFRSSTRSSNALSRSVLSGLLLVQMARHRPPIVAPRCVYLVINGSFQVKKGGLGNLCLDYGVPVG